jgi:EpsI family protein
MIGKMRFIVLLALIAGAFAYMRLHRDLLVPTARPFAEFPAAHRGWAMVGQSTLDENVLGVLKPTDYLSRRYARSDGSRVDLYLSFFNGGKDSGSIHSPKHCLPGSGWTELASRTVEVEIGGETITLVRAVYGLGDARELLLYWFDVRGQTLVDELALKFMAIAGSALHRRRDESFIRISAPTGLDEDRAMIQCVEFLRDFYPVIREFLPS